MNDTIIHQRQTTYTIDEAFAYCAGITNAHYENFPVASLFLPQEKRPYVQAIYAFSRTADDIADELNVPAQERLSQLEDWEQHLRKCYEGEAEHPIFIAMKETVCDLHIPMELLLDLLSAFKQDVVQHRYDTFEDLMSYCRRSANPVGRLVLIIFGYRDEELFKLSDHICSALQLANFWQDVDIDRAKDRLYIPLEDVKRFGYSLDMWNTQLVNDEFRALMKFQVDRTRSLFYDGSSLPSRVDKDLQLELKLVWFGGMMILKKLERVKYDVLHSRPQLSTMNKGVILLRAIMINDLGRWRRKEKLWDRP